ncbi:hypothetical protein XA68_10310 [Ophiocordyceps unilateralis]|uniref:Serine aminopeptidase S33 domain-containing protein n=1 Tax=Ophiocordyceps unilateralis TaxID=268505 RepID=A0A2A9PIZ7_OPHUN|nr:hypothetical protein XA68_10310 [Ophiocordyceps unilateralis]
MTVKIIEDTLTAADGHVLYTKAWEAPPDVARAALVWLHGFGDHCGRAESFFSFLASRGIAVHAFDQRGWGRSVHDPSHRGSIGPTETILSDITVFIEALRARTDLPLFLGGHSMGGAVALLWASEAPIQTRRLMRGFIAEAPLLRLHKSTTPSRALVWLARAVAVLLPNLPVRHGARHDDQPVDPLVNHVVSLRVTLDIWDRGEQVATGLCDLKEETQEARTGLWLAIGGDDNVVCPDAVRAYFDRSGLEDKQLRSYAGYGHELHTDVGQGKASFTEELVQWTSERATASLLCGCHVLDLVTTGSGTVNRLMCRQSVPLSLLSVKEVVGQVAFKYHHLRDVARRRLQAGISKDDASQGNQGKQPVHNWKLDSTKLEEDGY